MRGERAGGMAAVLFTDLVGSTALLARLGDAAFDEVRRAHFAGLRNAIEKGGGEEIKTLGDGILAAFGSAADGVAAAIAAQQSVALHAQTAGIPLALRVGLAVGDVSFEEADLFGTPVVEAARLVAAAQPGQILATSVVRMVAGARTQATFTDAGLLELKGLPEPVAACQVSWEPLAAAAPLPSLVTGAAPIFVGRNEALERLTQLWKEASAGERRVVLVSGEPGIGKTRLACELGRAIHAEGAVVLAGRCDESLGVPYQPFVEALRYYVRYVPAPRLGRHGGELARLVPELDDAVPGLAPPIRSDPETERYRLFDAVAAWLADASADAPLLLILDDVHWAAKPTLLLLRHVARAPETARLCIVATYRDSEVGRTHPLFDLLADFRRVEGVGRLPLTGLDQAAVSAFLEAAAGHALAEEDEELSRAVWAETEGNPFFVLEVIRHLSESGGVERRDGRWVLTAPVDQLGIPEGVRDVVGQRLSRLSETTNRILAVASVAGIAFEPAVVRAAGDFDEDTLLEALEEATGARLLSEMPGASPRYHFSHALVQATLYDELSAARRVALHRKVAESMEALHAGALDDHLPALTFHWARASAPTAETARAVEYASRAGDRALAQLAHDEAVMYYRQALELLGVAGAPHDDPRRTELLISLGEAQRRVGDPAHRNTLLEAGEIARGWGDAVGMARAALANTRGTFSALGVVDTERVQALQAAVDALGDTAPALRARLLAILAVELMWSGETDRRRALGDEALALARDHGDPRVLGSVISMRWATLWSPRWARERLQLATELSAIADDTGDPYLRFWGLWRGSLTSMELGDSDEADRLRHAAGRQADDLGHDFPRVCTMYQDVAVALGCGRLAEAELRTDEMASGLQRAQPDADVLQAVQLAGIRYEQGRLGELEPVLREMTARLRSVPFFRAMLSLAYCELGQEDAARSTFAPLSGGDPEGVAGDDWFALPTTALLAILASELGSTGDAAALSGVIAPYAGQVASYPIWLGSFSHHLGALATTLERFSEANAHFQAAAAAHERFGAPAWLARTRLEWARMLLRRSGPGDREQAQDLLRQALGPARDLGLLGVERQIVTLMET